MKKNMTVYAKKETVKHDWFLIDLKHQILGRAASKIATLLRGKHKSIYSPHVDCGDFVVAINAAKVRLSGKKSEQKDYFSHSGYPAGDTHILFEDLIKKQPVRIIRQAVAGMLPKSKLGKKMITKLKIYAGENHPHRAQQPKVLES